MIEVLTAWTTFATLTLGLLGTRDFNVDILAKPLAIYQRTTKS
jgi:hypothetical protein